MGIPSVREWETSFCASAPLPASRSEMELGRSSSALATHWAMELAWIFSLGVSDVFVSESALARETF